MSVCQCEIPFPVSLSHTFYIKFLVIRHVQHRGKLEILTEISTQAGIYKNPT
jgi:hypothetical protein